MNKKIQHCAILGMGALGMLFGSMIQENLGRDAIDYLMDSGRLERHKGMINTINDQPVQFSLKDAAAVSPYDLVIVAVKYQALRPSLAELKNAVGPDTILISVMNGIDSEEILAEQFDRTHILDCLAVGMDAMRDGNSLHYTKTGKIQIGALSEDQKPYLEEVTDFFDRAQIPYEVMPDIRQALWRKYMLNIGINQACTVYATDYAHATSEPIVTEMRQAMQEAVDVAAAEGVQLTNDDIEQSIALEKTLNPTSYPSMRQDIVAGRTTEVEMFAGTLIRLADRHGIPVPVNRRYYKKIKEIEATL